MEFENLKNIKIEGIFKEDYPLLCEAFISYAEFEGVPLTENELMDIQVKNPEKINQMAYMSLINERY